MCRIVEAAISGVSSHPASLPPSPPAHDLDLETRFETEAPYEQDDKVSVASGGSSSTLGSTPPKIELKYVMRVHNISTCLFSSFLIYVAVVLFARIRLLKRLFRLIGG